MKKTFFILMSIVMMIAFSSCSNDDSIVVGSDSVNSVQSDSVINYANQQVAFSELQNNIKQYNNEVFGVQNDYMTRGFFKKIWTSLKKTFITIIGADAVGAGLGVVNTLGSPIIVTVGAGLICGIASSVGTALLAISNNEPCKTPILQSDQVLVDNIFNPDSVVFRHVVPEATSPFVSKMDSVGFYHNKIIDNLFTNEMSLESFSALDDDNKAEILLSSMKKEPYLVKYYGNKLNDKDYIEAGFKVSETMVKIGNEAETEEDFFERLSKAGLTDPNIIGVLKDVLTGLNNLDSASDDGTYYQKMLDIILASNISDEAKEQLCNAVIIANASNHLWNKNELIEEPLKLPDVNGDYDEQGTDNN